MQQINALLFCSSLFVLMSFNGVSGTDEIILKTKTYGVCGCENAPITDSKVELTLHPDHTFHYLNASDSNQKVDVKGNWAMNGKKVVLQSDTGDKGFHKNWKFDKSQPCILSRKGLNFIRLCDIEMCK